METFGDTILPSFCPKFCCTICDYNTSKKSSFDYHISSAKHLHRATGDVGDATSPAFLPSKVFTCEKCAKTYSSRNGIWKHKKTCMVDTADGADVDNNKDLVIKSISKYDDEIASIKQLILLVMKQNTTVQDTLVELSKQTTINSNIINQTNSHNTHNSHNTTHNSFNLQFFLNETCKNAMNISDFANSIKLQLTDLIRVGEVGYVEGISNIIVQNLNALDVTERPVHCTDKKREIMYIKDAGKWEKDENEQKLKKFIKHIAFKNQTLFAQFKAKYPDCNESGSRYSDQYSKIVIESLDDSNPEKECKIIKKISKAVAIHK